MKCVIIDDDEITRSVVEIMIRNTEDLTLAASFSNAPEALAHIGKRKPDIIFLDIEMPEMNGFELLDHYKEQLPSVIMITSHKKYAAKAFDFDVTDFLVKPIVPSRFLKAVQKAKKLQDLQSRQVRKPVFVKTASQMVKVDPSDILFIKSLADYVVIHTAKEKLTIHSTMKGMFSKLPSGEFLRIHHSCIVRLDKIQRVESTMLSVSGYQLPVSRSKKKELQNAMKDLLH